MFATAGEDGAPHAALMLFVSDDDFSVFFGTCKRFKKYANLKRDARIALVVPSGGEDPETLIEMEGVAEEMPEEKTAEYRQRLMTETGSEFFIKDEPDLVIFKITPQKGTFIDGSSGTLSFSSIL